MAWDVIEIYYVYCNGCTDSGWNREIVGQSKSHAIRLANEAGWRVVGSQTLCPDCVKQIKQGGKHEA